MNNTVTCLLAFSSGAAVGAVISWKLLKEKYERIAQEEIDSVKEVFSKHADEKSITPEKEYTDILETAGYTDTANTNEEKGGSDFMDSERPYVIPPEEFGEFEDYDTDSLTYYADHVLTDDQGEPIDDVDGIVGLDSLNHFGDYEDDSVFVRNDRLKHDYEILLDIRKYSDVMSGDPLDEGE